MPRASRSMPATERPSSSPQPAFIQPSNSSGMPSSLVADVSEVPKVLRTRRNVPSNLTVCLPTAAATGLSAAKDSRNISHTVSRVCSMDGNGSATTQDSPTWFSGLPEKVLRNYLSPEDRPLLPSSPMNSPLNTYTNTRTRRITRVASVDEAALNYSQCSPLVFGIRRDRSSRSTLTPLSKRTTERKPAMDQRYPRIIANADENHLSRPPSGKSDSQLPASVDKTLRQNPSMYSISDTSHSTKSFGNMLPYSVPGSPSLDSPVQYYQDPDARMKLRVYLGSLQKFDEAVEFGFPSSRQSNHHTDAPKPTFRVVRDRTAIDDFQKFLKNDSLDFLDEEQQENQGNQEQNGESFFIDTLDDNDIDCLEQDDNITLSHTDSPRTPSNDRSFRLATKTSALSERSSSISYTMPAPMWSGEREMTLRMTLTRPELRAKDEEIYGWQREQGSCVADEECDSLTLDLLAPEPLPVLQDHSAFKINHPVGSKHSHLGSGTQGLWEKLKRRASTRSMRSLHDR